MDLKDKEKSANLSSDDPNSASVSDGSGDERSAATDQTDESVKKESVSVDTHRRLLGELKRAKDALAKIDAEKKTTQEKKLLEDKNYQELIKNRDEEINKLKAGLDDIQKQRADDVKFNSFIDAIPGKLEKKFWRWVDVSEIVINPETGQPDPTTVKKVVEKFVAEYPETIKPHSQTRMPNSSPGAGSAGITHEEWAKLKDIKKMKELLPLVYKTETGD